MTLREEETVRLSLTIASYVIMDILWAETNSSHLEMAWSDKFTMDLHQKTFKTLFNIP